MAHTVSVEEIKGWIDHESWFLAASSYGKNSAKRLERSNSGVFRVTDGETVTYLGGDIATAVAAYNAAP